MQWLPALEEAAATRGWRVVTYGKSSCAFSDAPAARAGDAYPQCDDWNAAVVDALLADPPDVVVTSGVAAQRVGGQRHRPRPPRRGLRLALAHASRMPGCRSSSSATAPSRRTTWTSVPPGTRAS